MSSIRRRALLVAALGFARLELQPPPPELATLQAWLGTWTGIGAVITGMIRQGFDVDLRSYEQGWRATFLDRHHVYRPWVGQVIRFHETPGQAVRPAAWEALSVPALRHSSVIEESAP